MKKEINGNKVHARLPSAIISTTSPDSTLLHNNNITTAATATGIDTSTGVVGNESLDVSPPTTTLVNNNNNTPSSSYDTNSTDSYSYYTQYSQYYYPNSGYDYNNEDLPPNAPLGMYDQNIYMNDQIHKPYTNNNRRGSGYGNRNRGYNNNNRKDDNRRGNRRKYSRGGGGGNRNNNNNNNSGRRNDDYNNNYYASLSSPQPVFQELSFPPLASDENTSTYKEPYISYTEDEIIKIVKNYTKFSLPPNLQPGDHSAAIGDKPNARLLELQRSMSIDQALEHSRPFRFDSVDSTDYSNMIYGNIDADTLSKKPLPSSQTGIIPPPFEPKGYAAVVKTGKIQQQQIPPPPSTTTGTATSNNNINKSNRSRTSSKDKKKDRKSKSNNNPTAATTTWSYFPAESSSSPSNATNTESNTGGANQSSNHHKSNRKGSNNLPSNKNNKAKSTSNTSDNSSTEPV